MNRKGHESSGRVKKSDLSFEPEVFELLFHSQAEYSTVIDARAQLDMRNGRWLLEVFHLAWVELCVQSGDSAR